MLKFAKSTKPARDRGYILWLCGNPCCICGVWDSTISAHHSLISKHKSLARKACDYETIPACYDCHINGIHKHGNETTYLANHGLPDGLTLARQYQEQYEKEKRI